MNRIIVALNISLAVLLLIPRGAQAYFERLYMSSRVIAMGGAFAGIADDPSAVMINPAGITGISGYSCLLTGLKPYGLQDLDESSISAVFPAGIGTGGFAWHRLALRGITAENAFSFGFARDYIRTSQDASLAFGGTIDIARVSYSSNHKLSKTLVTGSLGMLLRPFPIIGFGYTVKNIIPRSVDFLPGNGGTRLERTHTWSLAYHWNRKVTFVYDRTRDQDKIWKDHFGMEAEVKNGLVLRSGFDAGGVSGGVGLDLDNINIDIGAVSADATGVTYFVSMGFKIIPEKR